MLEEGSGPSGVFAGQGVDLSEDALGPMREIFEIANGCGDKDERGRLGCIFHSFISRGMQHTLSSTLSTRRVQFISRLFYTAPNLGLGVLRPAGAACVSMKRPFDDE